MRAAARRYHVSLCTVQRWVQRAGTQRLARVDWTDRSHATRVLARTGAAIESRVLTLRQTLRDTSDLGDYGAEAIRRALLETETTRIPSVRTIHRILERRGALDAQRRIRRPAPPPGWYLPDVTSRRAELDSFDFVEGLVIQHGPHVEVLNGISLHGGLIGSWPSTIFTAAATLAAMLAHWRDVGLPQYAQFDNDTRFQGPHQHPDVVSRVMRLCLSLGVTPVFAPPREHGFQNPVESLNGRWQTKVWGRFHHDSLVALQGYSNRFVAATRVRNAARVDRAPSRRTVPATWQLDLQAHPLGRLIFLRRTTDAGGVGLLGHTFSLDPLWPHRLVRCEVQLDAGVIQFYRLRRREPADQPLICERPYVLPQRRFRE
jgi:transposase